MLKKSSEFLFFLVSIKLTASYFLYKDQKGGGVAVVKWHRIRGFFLIH